MRISATLVVLGAVVGTACAGGGVPIGFTVADRGEPFGPLSDPLHTATTATVIERKAETTFLDFDIPVLETVVDGRVWSGWFIVGPMWGGALVENRVDCGTDEDDVPRARGREIELSVVAHIGSRDHGTHVTVSSTGQALPDPDAEEADRPHCRLSREFATMVASAISGEEPFDPTRRTSGR